MYNHPTPIPNQPPTHPPHRHVFQYKYILPARDWDVYTEYKLKFVYNAFSYFTTSSTDSQCQSDTQFWTDESTQCTCIENQLTCTQIACENGQPCSRTAQSKWSSDPFTSGTCKVMSDLRYTTFDGVKSSFMGHCVHVLTEVCDEDGLLPDFAVDVKNEQIGKSFKFQIQEVNLNIQSLRLTLMRRNSRKIMVSTVSLLLLYRLWYSKGMELLTLKTKIQ